MIKINFVSLLKKNQQGYFLIESLLAVILLSIFIMWLGQSYFLWKQEETDVYSSLYQLQHLLSLEEQWSHYIEERDNQLYFHQMNGDIVIVSLHNNKIRRQLNNRGHEELIRNINIFSIAESSSYYHLLVETNSGEKIEKYFNKKIPE